jgi:hypothetical protein
VRKVVACAWCGGEFEQSRPWQKFRPGCSGHRGLAWLDWRKAKALQVATVKETTEFLEISASLI